MMPDIDQPFSLKHLHTFGLPAMAKRLVAVATEADLVAAVQGCRDAGQRFHVLGEGSNTVFGGDLDATVIRVAIKGVERLQPDADFWRVRVAAGENWHEWVEWSLFNDMPGLENLALIPGSVGACPVQNIGAYGLEVMDRIESVRFLDLQTLQFRELPAKACRFSYRDSIFKHELAQQAIITAVTFALPRVWQANTRYADIARWLDARGIAKPSARDVFDAVVAVRTSKLPDPRVQGNAGSFFKNPLVSAEMHASLMEQHPGLVSYAQPDGRFKLAAGWLIDQAGLKGCRVGGAAVSSKQALVLVNLADATVGDLRALVAHVQTSVAARYGVMLEPEPVMIDGA